MHSAQLLLLVAIIVALVVLIRIELQGGGRKKRKRRKRSPSNSNILFSQFNTTDSFNYKYSVTSTDSLSSLDSLDYLSSLVSIHTLDSILKKISSAYKELIDERSVIAVEYEPLSACPSSVPAESCARWSWMSAGSLNQTQLPQIQVFGQECF